MIHNQSEPTDLNYSPKVHLFLGFAFIISSLIGITHIQDMSLVGAIVGFNYGFLLLHTGENKALKRSNGIIQYSAYGIWWLSLIGTITIGMLYVPIEAVSGGLGCGVGYLLGWGGYYR